MKLKSLFSALTAAALLLACTDPKGPEVIPVEPPLPLPDGLNSFTFEKANNPGLTSDIEMIMLDNDVIFGYPGNEIALTSLKPSFVATNATLTVGGVAQESGKTAHDFSRPVEYVMTCGGEKTTYTVKMIPYTGLPVVMLNTPGGKGFSKTILNKEDWIKGTILIDGRGMLDDYEGELSIRGRGNSSWNFPKKGFNVKMDKKDPILGMPKHKRWCFIPAWRDRSQMRNKLSFRIAGIADNMPWAPRSEYAEVVFNGEHMGLYDVTEHIRVDANRVHIDEMKAADIAEPAITGGYLLESDGYWSEELDAVKFKSKYLNYPFVSKNPDEDVMQPAQKTWIKDYIDSIEKAMLEGRFADVYELIDMPSFIDFWMVNAIAGNVELSKSSNGNGPYSVFLYKKRSGKLYTGPVWDFDFSTYSNTNTTYGPINRSTVHLTSWWYNELFKDPAFKAAAKARFLQLESRLRSEIPPFIEEQGAYLAKSVEVNWKMWPIDTNYLGSNLNGDETEQDYAKVVQRLKTIYLGRVDLIRSIVQEW